MLKLLAEQNNKCFSILSSNVESINAKMNEIISLIDKTNSDIIIAGDFNINLLKINETNIVGEFFDMLISNSFYPHITLPTRFPNNNGTLIDNLFCRIYKYAKQPKSGILTKQFSDYQPCFTFQKMYNSKTSHQNILGPYNNNTKSTSNFEFCT